MTRIHIPLWTNKKCIHICEGQNLHMEAGSVYVIWANLWHQIRNDSDEDRYHIIMDVYDTKKITQHFKYEGDFSQLEEFARRFNQEINEIELTEDDINFFEAIKDKYVTNYNVN